MANTGGSASLSTSTQGLFLQGGRLGGLEGASQPEYYSPYGWLSGRPDGIPPREEEPRTLPGPHQGPVLHTDPGTLWQNRLGSLPPPEESP